MVRSLRPRKNRSKYRNSPSGGSADDLAQNDEVGSSDFAPDDIEPTPTADGNDEDASVKGHTDDEMDQVTSEVLAQSQRTHKGKDRAKRAKGRAAPIKSLGLEGTPASAPASARQTHLLATPSNHHWHRAPPLFARPGLVERLETPPSPFQIQESQRVATNNFTATPEITERLSKSWGRNVGPGPLWQLAEDRGWYKEGFYGRVDVYDVVDTEVKRRPVVYSNAQIELDCEVLDARIASTYLPADTIAEDGHTLEPASPLVCSVGPVDSQTRVKLGMFETRNMCEFVAECRAHIFNAGAPIWGLDWCPINKEQNRSTSHKQYLAIAPFPNRSHSPKIGKPVTRPSKACIQIWSIGPDRDAQPDNVHGSKMKCEMVLCIDGGPAYEIRWCPLPSHDLITDSPARAKPRRLGLLAGTFEDGSVTIFAVPLPADVIPVNHDSSKPVFIRLSEPLVRFELADTACLSLDWGNSEILAVGCTNGFIAVFDVAGALKTRPPSQANLLPTHYLGIHQSPVRAVTWIRVPPSSGTGEPLTDEDPTIIASGGYDGMECLWDISEMTRSVVNRTRDVINSMTFSPFIGGFVTIDHENIVKAYSLSPTMLGRGHTLMEPAGPVWSIAASDYHPQLAVGSADGFCATTNTLRSPRSGGSVPFFVHKIYQMDYHRETKEFRMLERFLPQVRPRMHPSTKPGKTTRKPAVATPGANAPAAPGTGAWPTQVGVHRVAWNCGNGLEAAGLLASGTASGLGRVDFLEGRWFENRVPYTSVVNIRREGVEVVPGEESEAETEDELEEEGD